MCRNCAEDEGKFAGELTTLNGSVGQMPLHGERYQFTLHIAVFSRDAQRFGTVLLILGWENRIVYISNEYENVSYLINHEAASVWRNTCAIPVFRAASLGRRYFDIWGAVRKINLIKRSSL